MKKSLLLGLKMADNIKTATSSLKEVLRIMDLCLGSFTAILSFSIFIYNLTNGLDLIGPLFILFFLIYNLVLSQISIRTTKSQSVEVFRHFTTLTFLCPLSLVLVKEPFSPFWFLYLIMIVSSSSIFFEVSRGHLYSIYATIYGILSYVIASLILIPDKPVTEIALHVWVMGMLSFLLHQILKLVDRSYRREQHKSQELFETLKDLEEAQQSLIYSSRLNAIGEMAGGIAHEINNPLTIISGSVFKLKKEMQSNSLSDEELKKNLDRISDTVKRITQIVTSLRIVSRDSSNGEKLIEVAIRDILQDALSICSERFKAHGIDLKLSLDDEEFDTLVKVDRVQLSQVFLNLLSNSYDAIEGQEDSWIRIKAFEEGKMLVIKLTDSGKGISQEHHEKIFDPFYTTKEVGKGTGLGLSISKSILEKNQGELTLDTHAKNTTLIVKVPKA
ncbi:MULTISPECIES: sensor histidine kinase [unclassified Halobacteriovorax]|uniref:sensor histidine kinase n=1 Tax=unclassified Halobacteriovorax TaxID=2639665 RepID=UPI000EA33048|nr:ATP-binding protein [Halobacteriovorax sp. BALOs_7]